MYATAANNNFENSSDTLTQQLSHYTFNARIKKNKNCPNE